MPLHGAMLFVKDLSRMTAFYRDVLKLPRIEATLASIEGMGLPVLRRPWGGVEVVDPEGNIVALSRQR